MRDILYKLNPWWEGEYKTDFIERETYLRKLEGNLGNKQIILVTGLRRVGKTTLLKIMIERLLKKEKPDRILYAPLDAFGLEKYSIHDIISEFRKIHGHALTEKLYVFLDEVAKKENFEHELKDLCDNENVKIFASSSSASILLDKKAELTGRTKLIEVMPLCFREFLLFRGLTPKKSEKYLLEKYFEDYMETGGIPEYVRTGDSEYVTGLIDDILQKDIIAHYGVKDKGVVTDLFRLLCERAGKPMTYNKLSNVLGTSVDTVKRYIGYMENTYLIYVVEKSTRSLNERVTAPRKIYLGDVGIRNLAVGFKDLGSVYENLVFLEIKNGEPRYVSKDGVELDFAYDDTLLECKYKRELSEKQKALFDGYKAKSKIVADGVDFFYE